MAITGLGIDYGVSAFYTPKASRGIGKQVESFAETTGIHLHMNDQTTGDKAVTSIGFPDGSSASVFASENGSEYSVKYWDANGSEEEYEFNAEKISPSNANYLEMLAYTSHLDITGQTNNAFGDFIAVARGVNGDRTYNSGNVLATFDFKRMTEEFMQAQYGYGNMTGYMSVKSLYDHMSTI